MYVYIDLTITDQQLFEQHSSAKIQKEKLLSTFSLSHHIQVRK